MIRICYLKKESRHFTTVNNDVQVKDFIKKNPDAVIVNVSNETPVKNIGSFIWR